MHSSSKKSRGDNDRSCFGIDFASFFFFAMSKLFFSVGVFLNYGSCFETKMHITIYHCSSALKIERTVCTDILLMILHLKEK